MRYDFLLIGVALLIYYFTPDFMPFFAVFLILLSLIIGLKYFIDGYLGNNQYPNPHGRYYSQWLDVKEKGDYYDWLAKKKGKIPTV